jgi:O-acetyl-ADP-ribose deacetylase (regulator of RNase III)
VKYVFHTVGPIYRKGVAEQAEILASCYKSCLGQAENLGLRIIAFPSISTGAYGYPIDEAAAVAIEAVGRYLKEAKGSVETAMFVLFDQKTYHAYAKALESWGRNE